MHDFFPYSVCPFDEIKPCDCIANVEVTHSSSCHPIFPSLNPSVWGFSFLSVTAINAFSLTGVLITPVTKTYYVKYLFIFFIALAIGTLFSTAILQFIPEVWHPYISYTLTAHECFFVWFTLLKKIVKFWLSSPLIVCVCCLCFFSSQVFLLEFVLVGCWALINTGNHWALLCLDLLWSIITVGGAHLCTKGFSWSRLPLVAIITMKQAS